MYAPVLIAQAESTLSDAYRQVFPQGLAAQRRPAPECIERSRLLGHLRNEDGTLLRPLTAEEQSFILAERLLAKIDFRYFAERYVHVNKAGQALEPLYPLWESQEIILSKISEVEEERAESGHPDGILVLILKGRQLGASTISQALLVHRSITHTNIKALIGSDTPDNSGSDGLFGMFELILANVPWWLKPEETFHQKNRHVHFSNGSVVRTESGKSMKGGLTEEGGDKGQMGRSKTYSVLHLSEISTWEHPEQIDDSLMPAVPQTPRTLMIMESTAKGRANRWHHWWNLACQGAGRFTPIFVPWYAEKTKWWLPAPVNWTPDAETLAHAKQAEFHGPKYMKRAVRLTRNQLYWYERERYTKEAVGELYKFRSEFPSMPEEAFQYSGRSIFPLAVQERIRAQAKPILAHLEIKSAAELSQMQQLELAEQTGVHR